MISAAGVRTFLIEGETATVNLTIEDDGLACPWSLQEIGDATWTGTNVPNNGNNTASVITTAYDGVQLTMHGLGHSWIEDPGYWDEVITNSASVVFTVNDITGAVTIEEQFTATSTWNGAVQPDYYVYSGGSFDTCGKILTLNYDLIQGGSVTDSGTETITMD